MLYYIFYVFLKLKVCAEFLEPTDKCKKSCVVKQYMHEAYYYCIHHVGKVCSQTSPSNNYEEE